TLGASRKWNITHAHNSISPITNTLLLQRTKHPWYANNNLNAWKEVFLNNKTPGTTTFYPSTNLTDNGTPLGMGTRDARINVTTLAREILNDEIAGLNYATAFKLSLKD